MKSFGPLYVGKLEYYHRNILPVLEVGWTQEVEDDFREGRCLIFRVPKTLPGYYIGLFTKRHRYISDEDADDLIIKAVKGRDIDLEPEEIENWNV
jgi:hypothetical protein